MNIFPLVSEKKPAYNTRRAARRYVRREVSRKCRKSIDEINSWLDEESFKKKYHMYFIKIYFEWRYILRGKRFNFNDMVERNDEYEFIELLNIIKDELGLHYSEFPFKFEIIINELKEKVIGDSKQQHNSRKNCYIWSNE
ncbi:hypothetical protein HKO22_03075 [Peptoniphilus sp. AGMB00490]|uniref:Uncharacterized protein n=1 Tax=Peptoniphilus faecalis TaxID=2731255 RepID=A0A848R644_9FIRM|nr:hypothetical protein [Peptoniphilus faecalis]NMW84727.1 hypothetical protein [Peptoniphilus faecalis]